MKNYKEDLPKLEIIDKIGNRYLFTYQMMGKDYYTYISDEGVNYRLEISASKTTMNMVVDKQSRMGVDITYQIQNIDSIRNYNNCNAVDNCENCEN